MFSAAVLCYTNRTFRILCNVSGSGKTRRLLEGLCQHWGFYFVAQKSSDGLGMPDLKNAINAMQDSPGWVNNIFKMENPAKVNSACLNNERIAMHALDKLFLARWIVLQTFIDVVSDDNQGKLPSSIRHDWLLFQLHHADFPIIKGPSKLRDPFTHIFWGLSGASKGTLTTLINQYACQVLAIIKAPFFCVIDEAQVAGEVHMGAFSSSDGKTPRPVLRPLVQYIKMFSNISLIVSGTGFSLSLFREVMGSRVQVCKATTPPFVDHFTGNFFEEEAQLSYVARYLPHTYLDSESGKHLKTRIRRWLRGRCVATKVLESQLNPPCRHRFTARYLEVALEGTWKGDQPASPHKLLNAYVQQMTSVAPCDGDKTILDREDDCPSLDIPTFDWTKLNNGKSCYFIGCH